MYIVSRFQMLIYRDWTLSFGHFAGFFSFLELFLQTLLLSHITEKNLLR